MSSLREGAVSRRLTEGACGRIMSKYALITDLHPAARKLPHPACAGSFRTGGYALSHSGCPLDSPTLPEGAGTLSDVQFNY